MSAVSKRLDPLIDKFETQEEAASYDKWFRAMVQVYKFKLDLTVIDFWCYVLSHKI